MPLKNEVLKYFYRFNGYQNEFIKNYYTRFLRNRIIDPNTKNIIDHGVKYFNKNTNSIVNIPCDDTNWNEFITYDLGFQKNVLKFPFTIKLYHDNFITLNDYQEFDIILKKMIEFRTNTIKHGWAIKYGLEYEDKTYPVLEDLTEKELLNWNDPRIDASIKLENITEDDLKG